MPGHSGLAPLIFVVCLAFIPAISQRQQRPLSIRHGSSRGDSPGDPSDLAGSHSVPRQSSLVGEPSPDDDRCILYAAAHDTIPLSRLESDLPRECLGKGECSFSEAVSALAGEPCKATTSSPAQIRLQPGEYVLPCPQSDNGSALVLKDVVFMPDPEASTEAHSVTSFHIPEGCGIPPIQIRPSRPWMVNVTFEDVSFSGRGTVVSDYLPDPWGAERPPTWGAFTLRNVKASGTSRPHPSASYESIVPFFDLSRTTGIVFENCAFRNFTTVLRVAGLDYLALFGQSLPQNVQFLNSTFGHGGSALQLWAQGDSHVTVRDCHFESTFGEFSEGLPEGKRPRLDFGRDVLFVGTSLVVQFRLNSSISVVIDRSSFVDTDANPLRIGQQTENPTVGTSASVSARVIHSWSVSAEVKSSLFVRTARTSVLLGGSPSSSLACPSRVSTHLSLRVSSSEFLRSQIAYTSLCQAFGLIEAVFSDLVVKEEWRTGGEEALAMVADRFAPDDNPGTLRAAFTDCVFENTAGVYLNSPKLSLDLDRVVAVDNHGSVIEGFDEGGFLTAMFGYTEVREGWYPRSFVNIRNSEFRRNRAFVKGGAVLVNSRVTRHPPGWQDSMQYVWVEICNSTFVENSAGGVGGGGLAIVSVASTTLNVSECHFAGNTAPRGTGGGVRLESLRFGMKVTVQETTLITMPTLMAVVSTSGASQPTGNVPARSPSPHLCSNEIRPGEKDRPFTVLQPRTPSTSPSWRLLWSRIFGLWIVLLG